MRPRFALMVGAVAFLLAASGSQVQADAKITYPTINKTTMSPELWFVGHDVSVEFTNTATGAVGWRVFLTDNATGATYATHIITSGAPTNPQSWNFVCPSTGFTTTRLCKVRVEIIGPMGVTLQSAESTVNISP